MPLPAFFCKQVSVGLRSGVVRGNCGRTSAFRFKVVGIFERGCSEIRKPLHNATEKDFHFQTGFELRSRRGLREGGFQSAAVAVRIQFRIEQGFVRGLGLVVILDGVFLFRSDHLCGIVAVFRDDRTGTVIERSHAARRVRAGSPVLGSEDRRRSSSSEYRLRSRAA